MNKQQIISWIRQVDGMNRTVSQISEAIDTLKGQYAVSTAVQNQKHVADITTELDRLRRDRERIVEALLNTCHTTDLDGVETRVTDISARLEMAEKYFNEWRRLLAVLEHLATTDGFENAGVERPTLEANIDSAKANYETAMQNAAQLVPNKATLIV